MNTENNIIEVTEYKEEVKQTGIRQWIRKIFDYLRTNSIRIEKDGTEIITIKLILFLILCLFVGEIVLPLMLVGLFFKIRYTFVGRNQNEQLNDLMDRASCVAQASAQGFQKAWNEK
ncbi:MAG: hypothetical protein KBT48_04685 [Firmicutes bacterium]|nr:hypothetical protein [Bacillota bacterium]